MNPLLELCSQCTPERLLADPQASGAGVSVALIDSGVERSVIVERHPGSLPIEGGVFVSGRPKPFPYQGVQSTPHGTTVADIVLSLAPGVKLYSTDIFGPAGSTEVDVLLRALEWAVDEWKCKVINLSLGVAENRLTTPAKRQQFQRAVESAYFKDVVLVAAAHNDHPLTRSYPALLGPPLLGVDKGLFEAPLDFTYFLNEAIEFQAHARGYLGPLAHEPATSWAVPHLTAIVARLLSLKPDLKPFEVKTLLYWMHASRKGARREH